MVTLRDINKHNPHIVGEIIMTGVKGMMFGIVTLRGINKHNPHTVGEIIMTSVLRELCFEL